MLKISTRYIVNIFDFLDKPKTKNKSSNSEFIESLEMILYLHILKCEVYTLNYYNQLFTFKPSIFQISREVILHDFHRVQVNHNSSDTQSHRTYML